MINLDDIDITRFRPLLGFFIFQLKHPHIQHRITVSVPYWGSLYFNCLLLSVIATFLFPSPIGVLYISIQNSLLNNGGKKMFPSPIGVLYISMPATVLVTHNLLSVSVPYWGSLYFNASDDLPHGAVVVAFPSPTGVLYISIKHMNL